MIWSKLVSSFCACLALCVASKTSAALLVYEPFTNTGQLLGQTNASNGNNWLRAGTSTTDTAINVVSGNLTLPSPMPVSQGNELAMTGIGDGSGSSTRLALGQTISSGTVYYSFEFRGDALTGSNNTIGGFFIGLNNTGNTAQTTNPSVAAARIQARIDPVDGTKYDLGIFSNVAAVAGAASWLPAMTIGDSHFIVVGYTFNTSTTTDDVASIWIDPNPSTFGAATPPAPDKTATGGDVSSPGVLSLILRQSPAPYFTMDELRIGTEWNSVTVPEPASIGTMALGLILLAGPLRQRAA
jgi:hypothetical protein